MLLSLLALLGFTRTEVLTPEERRGRAGPDGAGAREPSPSLSRQLEASRLVA